MVTDAAASVKPPECVSRCFRWEIPALRADGPASTSSHWHSKPMGPSKIASMNPPLKFVAIAFSDYGGIGFEFYSTVVKPHFEKLRVGEGGPGGASLRALSGSGGSGWDARKKKSEFNKFLQRASITIAMGNSESRVLGCMRHDSDWRSTARSAPQCCDKCHHWQTWSL